MKDFTAMDDDLRRSWEEKLLPYIQYHEPIEFRLLKYSDDHRRIENRVIALEEFLKTADKLYLNGDKKVYIRWISFSAKMVYFFTQKEFEDEFIR